MLISSSRSHCQAFERVAKESQGLNVSSNLHYYYSRKTRPVVVPSLNVIHTVGALTEHYKPSLASMSAISK